jgi:hypothetical protein
MFGRVPWVTSSPKQTIVAALVALSMVLAGSAELIRRAADPSTEQLDVLATAPTHQVSPTVAPTPNQQLQPTRDPSLPTPLPGLDDEQMSDLASMLNGFVPETKDGKPRLDCDDPLTISPGASATASCVLYPDAFRGPVKIGCGDTFECYPAQQDAIEVISDHPKRIDIVFNVPASEALSRITVTVEVYAFGDHYFPVEIIVPQPPATG